MHPMRFSCILSCHCSEFPCAFGFIFYLNTCIHQCSSQAVYDLSRKSMICLVKTLYKGVCCIRVHLYTILTKALRVRKHQQIYKWKLKRMCQRSHCNDNTACKRSYQGALIHYNSPYHCQIVPSH